MYKVPFIQHTGLRAVQKNGLTLVRYTKPLSDPVLGLYRSAVFNNGRLVSFTPPKALEFEEFSSKHPIDTVRVEEFVDGTMVYAYHDGEWRVGTRSVCDAETTYRCGMAVPYFNLPPAPAPPFIRDVFLEKVGAGFFDALRQNCVYVFSFMSPLTFNVLKGDGVYLTAVYEIQDNEARLVDGGRLPPVVQYPKTYTAFTSYADLVECADEVPHTCKGFMLHAGGERTKVVGTAYTQVKNLLDNQPNVNRCLLKLLRERRECELLALYPEFGLNVVQIRAGIKSFTNGLYTNYLECFCAKARPLREYPPKYKPHMYELHKIYKEQLRPASRRVNKQEVVKYVAGLCNAQLAAALSL